MSSPRFFTSSSQLFCRVPSIQSMRLPGLLVIGAMKAGTTSLCSDLASNPDIFFPSVKEPHHLCRNEVLSEDGMREYATLFRKATVSQLCAEGSTGYTKLPQIRGIPNRARKVLGANLKLIYIVRDPIARICSHHFHLYRAGRVSADINHEIRSSSQYIDFTRYAMQLRAWLNEFPRGNIEVVRFEDYIADRGGVNARLCRFLGIEPRTELIETQTVLNRGEESRRALPMLLPLIRSVKRTKYFKPYVHPWTPQLLRNAIKVLAYRSTRQTRPPGPMPTTVQYILESLADDLEDLRNIIGSPGPVWDLDLIP